MSESSITITPDVTVEGKAKVLDFCQSLYYAHRKDMTWVDKADVYDKLFKVLHQEFSSLKRTEKLNNYYWGVCLFMIASRLKDLGYDNHSKNDAHQLVKIEFLCDYEASSTAELSISQFIEYLESIKRWSAEMLDIVIPDPQ